MTNTIQTPQPVSDSIRRIPLWLNILVLLIVLGAGGWFLWSQWIGGSPGADKPVDIGKVNYNRPMYRSTLPPAMVFNRPGVYPAGPPNTFLIRNGDYSMTLTRAESALFPLRLFYVKPDLVNQSVWEQLLMARDITSNPARVKALNITPDQAAKLTALFQNAGAGLILSDPDRQTLRTDWKSYNDAKDDAGRLSAQTALLAAVKDIGDRSLEPTRTEFKNRGDRVSQILTADQISQYHQSRGR